MNIPQDLVTEYKQGHVLVFVGEGINGDEWARLATVLVGKYLPERPPDDLSPPEVAQEYWDTFHNLNGPIQTLSDFFQASDRHFPAHQLLASLTAIKTIVTTCVDERIEHAFDEAGRVLHVITRQTDMAYGKASETARLYKLHGTISQPDTLKLTEEEIQALYYEAGGLSAALKGRLAESTILLIGFALDDPLFQQLYLTSIAPLDRHARRAYALGGPYSRKVNRFCGRNNIVLLDNKPADFLHTLIQTLETEPPSTPSVRIGRPLISPGTRPYKKLFAYEPEDAALFFGRRAEAEHLLSLILAHRLVVLHGASGTGKSSLLGAGITPYLSDHGYVVVRIGAEAWATQGAFIPRQIAEHLPQETLGENQSLADAISTSAKALGKPVVVLLDQFEDFFIRLSPAAREAFTIELARALQHAASVKWILSLRSEWFSALSEMRAHLPEIYKAEFRLEPLSAQAAREAIEGPAASVQMHVEPHLTDLLLRDLGQVVQLPQLQLVCNAVYDAARRAGKTQLGLTEYTALGGAEGILAGYLDNFLRRHTPTEAAHIRKLLLALVTLEGTVAELSKTELCQETGIDQEKVTRLLDELEDERLVRTVERADQPTAYQLAHSYLAETLAVEPALLAKKAVQELVRQEVSNWQRLGTLISQDKLAYLRNPREPIEFPEAAQELIFRSALHYDYEIGYWAEHVVSPEIAKRVIAEHLKPDRLADARSAAALSALQHLKDGTTFKPLLTTLVLDATVSRQVRRQAAICLARLNPETAIAELRQHHDGRALEAIADMYQAQSAGLVRLVERPTLGDRLRIIRSRLEANRVYIVRTVVMAMLGGSLGGLLGGLVLVWPKPMEYRWIFMLGSVFLPGLLGLVAITAMCVAEAIRGDQRWSTRSVGGLIGGVLSGFISVFPGDSPTPDALLFQAVVSMSMGGFAGWAITSALTLADSVAPRYRRRVRALGGLLTGLATGAVAGSLLIGRIMEQPVTAEELAFILALGFMGIALGLELAPAVFVKNVYTTFHEEVDNAYHIR